MSSEAGVVQMIQQFAASMRGEIIAAANSLQSGNTASFDQIVARVENHALVKQISSFVNSSTASFNQFMDELSEISPLVGGFISAGVGGAMLAEAAGIAAALGITLVSAKLIAILLIIYGIYLAVPAVWDRINVEEIIPDLADL